VPARFGFIPITSAKTPNHVLDIMSSSSEDKFG